jgi:archaellum biogenesis protein FlaJ (TadC family)
MLTYNKMISTKNTDFTLFIRESGSAASLVGDETKTLALLNKHK